MLLTLKSAAGLLQVSEDQVTRWMQSQGLPARTVQDRIQFDRIELLEWAWRNKRPICPSVGATDGDTWTPMLAAALELGGIHYHLPGDDKATVYRALIDALPLPETVDRAHTAASAAGPRVALPDRHGGRAGDPAPAQPGRAPRRPAGLRHRLPR